MDLMISQVIDGNTAIAPSKGESVHEKIKQALIDQETVILDFTGMELMTTAFLNSAIGQLYAEFSTELLRDKLKIKWISQSDAVLLKKVTDTAKIYFANPADFEGNINERING
ncbi:STAS-like domain-containing protein [Pedobacter miscanthi]|uniref:DUF4325 domain-containing protein n=1 Tax=Pedobacter miscanthi TaxID=2259170 RepID=A0A366L3U1_9SPHI|nr:STAS-like domain-containing protein [Pedobacter miscanthi]RBQ07812.1 hypothetical protein DRW42_09415 [Pedobacter miscanthi]